LKEIPLKNAADSLNINYSTAKTILRIFRVEKRMAKKNSIDESELKKLLIQLKNKKNTDCNEGNLKSKYFFSVLFLNHSSLFLVYAFLL